MMQIESISLRGALPAVFVNENIPASEVWKCNVTFRRGEFYLVEAASGGGKSSMCAYIYGSRTDYVGDILFNSGNISALTVKEWQQIRRTNLAYLPQDLMLFPELSALDNIRLKARLAGDISDAKIMEWLDRLGVSFRADYPAGKMSIGQQQRVALIRSICQPFDFLLLDEPVSHLDEENNRIAAEIVAEAANAYGAGIISTSVGNHLLLPYTQILHL